MAVTTEQVADAMYELVAEYQGKKKFKPGDLIKAMKEKYGEDEVDKKLCKGGRCSPLSKRAFRVTGEEVSVDQLIQELPGIKEVLKRV